MSVISITDFKVDFCYLLFTRNMKSVLDITQEINNTPIIVSYFHHSLLKAEICCLVVLVFTRYVIYDGHNSNKKLRHP